MTNSSTSPMAARLGLEPVKLNTGRTSKGLSQETLVSASSAQMNLVINIPMSKSDGLWYLSNASSYPITIDDISYISVEHYLLAKKFAGEKLENDIVMCSNILKARVLAKPKRISNYDESTGRITKKMVYGTIASYLDVASVDRAWTKTEKDFILRAIKAKFDQHRHLRRKLMETRGTDVIDPKNPLVGPILCEIRDDISGSGAEKSAPILLNVDMESDRLTDEDIRNIDGIVKIANDIRDNEGIEMMHIEMFEDAFYNIGLSDSRYNIFIGWIMTLVVDWSTTLSLFPNFYSVVKSIETRLLKKKLNGYTSKDYINTAILLATFVKWYKQHMSESLRWGIYIPQSEITISRTVVSNIFIIKPDTIVIPPKQRKYRTAIPSVVQSRHDRKRIILDETFGDFGLIVRLDGKTITLRVDSLDAYRPHILAIGGKITSATTVEFHHTRLHLVQNMIYKHLPIEKRYDMIYRCWLHDKVMLLADTKQRCDLIASLRVGHSHLESETLYLKLLGLTTRTSTERPAGVLHTGAEGDHTGSGLAYINNEFSSANLPATMISALSHHIIPTAEIKKDIKVLILSKEDYDTVYTRLSEICGWRSGTELNKFLASPQSCWGTTIGGVNGKFITGVLLSMANMISLLSPSGSETHRREEVPSQEIIAWAFLTLVPKEFRSRFELDLREYKLQDHPSDDRSKDIVAPPPEIINNEYISKIYYYIEDIQKDVILTSLFGRCQIFGAAPVSVLLPTPYPRFGGGTSENEGVVIDCEGDLRTFQLAPWICVIANITSTTTPPKKTATRSERATLDVYEKYGYANVYVNPDREGPYSPRTIMTSIPADPESGEGLPSNVAHRHVITLFAEYGPGGPKKQIDTRTARLKWFRSAVARAAGMISKSVLPNDRRKSAEQSPVSKMIAISSVSLMDYPRPPRLSSEEDVEGALEYSYRDILISTAKKYNIIIYVLSKPSPYQPSGTEDIPTTDFIEIPIGL